jgi:hypothetical protein
MKTTSRRGLWAGVIVATLVATAGCDPVTSLYFLCSGMDPKDDPECKLVRDHKKQTKVVILTTSALETRPELLGADRELTTLLAQKLQEGFRENKEHVVVISGSKVQRFKDEHPNWKSLRAEDIGKYFDADMVIDLEVGSLTLYEPRSYNQFFRGQAEISIAVTDMSKVGDDPVIFKKEYTCEYPRSRGPVPVSDSNPQKFRLEFLTRVATDLSWLFTAHRSDENYPCD